MKKGISCKGKKDVVIEEKIRNMDEFGSMVITRDTTFHTLKITLNLKDISRASTKTAMMEYFEKEN